MYLEGNERANKAGVILAKQRYNERLGKFVGDSPERLEFVQNELHNLAVEAAAETGADAQYVRERLDKVLADTLPVLEPKIPHEELEYKSPDNDPPKFQSDDPLADITKTDIKDTEAVLLEESLHPERSTIIPIQEGAEKHGCFRCEASVEGEAVVCEACENELHALALEKVAADFTQPEAPMDPANPNMLMQCAVCKTFQGTREQVQQHAMAVHQQEMRELQQQEGQLASIKEAEVPGEDEDIEVPPTDKTPTARFENIAQQIANREAARQFSAASDDEIRAIAERYEVDEDTIRESLVVTATFGEFSAANGNLEGEVSPPEGLGEVDMDELGGVVEAREALVPVNIVVTKVADEMNMEEDLVYNMVRDHHGGVDLDTFHASVTGEHHFYLPLELIERAPAPPETPLAQPDPTVGPVPQQPQV